MEFLKELINKIKFYHGSMTKLPVGTILSSRDSYEDNWKQTDFYSVLEKYRPKNMIAHKDAVFMCDNEDDIDLAGGGTEYIFVLLPLDRVERHDVNWSSEISMLVSDGYNIDSNEVKTAALNYWNGVPHPNEQVWEYLTTKAKILDVYEY